MPNNLETLELTISGNSTSAKEGIETLVSSLSSLGSVVEKSCSGLEKLNRQLKELKSYENIKLPNLSSLTGAAAVQKGAMQYEKAKKLLSDMKSDKAEAAISKEEAISMLNMSKAELTMRKAQNMAASYVDKAQQGMSKDDLTNQALKIKAVTEQYEKLENAEGRATKATKGEVSTLGKLKQGFGEAGKGVTKFLGRVGRIASTMLIRSAIRAIIKDIKEGVNNVYEWSKVNNGAFAKSLDSLKNKSGELKNSFGAAISPAIQAAIPLINTLASAAINALNWVNQLISLLTGKGSWTKATEGVHDYAAEVKKAGGAAQDWLATFDELNVMTSGGGGGGGGSNVDYTDMFEEVYKFDDQVKEIAGFLKDNMESIRLIAVAIGVAIAGWKLSQGFADVLPTLSKVAGLIGVGAVIAIQLTASYMLTDKYLKTGQEGWLIASALTTAIGAAAAGTIAKKIFGGKIASATVSFALIANAITDIVANVKNTDVKAFSKEGLLTSISAALKAGAGAGVLLYAFGGMSGLPLLAAAGGAAIFTFLVSTGLKLMTQKDSIKWGNISLTELQVKSFVEDRMFEANPRIIINVISDNIEAGKVDRNNIQKDLMEMVGTYEVVKLGIDMQNSVKLLRDQANQLIEDVRKYIVNAKETGKLTIQFTPTLVGKTPEEQASWFTGYAKGWDIVDKFYADKGKEIASLFVENEKGEIKLKNPELLQEIMASLNEVTSAVTESNIVSSALAKMQLGIGDLTQASGESVINYFKQYKTDLENAYKDLVTEQYIKQGELVAALAKIDPNSEEYKQAVEDYKRMGENLAQAVQDGVESKSEPGKNMLMEWLLGRHGKGSVNVTWTDDYIRDFINVDGLADTLKGFLTDAGFDKYELEAMQLIGITGWDFLHKDLKKRFLNSVYIDENTIEELKALGVPASELVEIVNWDVVSNMAQNDFVKAMTKAYGADSISAIKQRFPNIKANAVVSLTAWDEFTNAEKLNFIDAIAKAFGTNEAVTAAKQAGINLEAAVREGMSSKNEDVKAMAKKWAELMGIEIRGGDYTVKPKVDDNSKPKIQGKIAEFISGTNGKVTKIDAEVPESAKTTVKNTIAGISAVVQPKANVTSAVKDGVKSEFETIKPTVSVTAKASVTFNDLKGAFVKALGNVQSYLGNVLMGKITFKSGGGLVSSGDMFVANENGVPEMIGRFGNQTAVANTAQIVDGISKGVADANEEQNYLLREQNQLLRAILEKEGSNGIPAASAAFGRTVARSLNMYNGLAGGR